MKKIITIFKKIFGLDKIWYVSGVIDFYSLDTNEITHRNIIRQYDLIKRGQEMIMYDDLGQEVNDGCKYTIVDYIINCEVTMDDGKVNKNNTIIYKKIK